MNSQGLLVFLFQSFTLSFCFNSKNVSMRHLKIIMVVVLAVAAMNIHAQRKVKLKNHSDSISYAMGVALFQTIDQVDKEADIDLIARALEDMRKERAIMSYEDAEQYVMRTMDEQEQVRIRENREEGEAFLSENADKQGVVTTESGLQYKVIKQGDGPIPDSTSRVKVHYEGTLIDGSSFDSSRERGEPAIFGVDQVIEGWTELLQLMPVGSVYKAYLPADLAYGDRSMRGAIEPGSVLVFKIELLEIVE